MLRERARVSAWWDRSMLLFEIPRGDCGLDLSQIWIRRVSDHRQLRSTLSTGQGRWDGGRFASPDFQMQNVGAFADARAPQRQGARMTGKGTRVRSSARMSCSRMTLIDSVAPFGLFFLLPVREGGATSRLPGGWNGDKVHTPCALPSRVRFWVGLCLSIDINSFYTQIRLLYCPVSKYGASHIVTSVCCNLLTHRYVSQPPSFVAHAMSC